MNITAIKQYDLVSNVKPVLWPSKNITISFSSSFSLQNVNKLSFDQKHSENNNPNVVI